MAKRQYNRTHYYSIASMLTDEEGITLTNEAELEIRIYDEEED